MAFSRVSQVLIVALMATLSLPAGARAASIVDPTGDFLATYTGVQGADLDVVLSEVALASNQLQFSATLAGNVGQTAGAFYVWGLDRGQGTQRFVSGNPSVGAGVFFDSVVVVRPDGSGSFNDLINGANSFTLAPSSITISGSQIFANIDAALIPSTGFAAQNYTWNLWPRLGAGSNSQISDFAPDASNAAVTVAIPEPAGMTNLFATLGFAGLLSVGVVKRYRHAKPLT